MSECPSSIPPKTTSIIVKGCKLLLVNEKRGPEYKTMFLKESRNGRKLSCIYQDTFLAYDFVGDVPLPWTCRVWNRIKKLLSKN